MYHQTPSPQGTSSPDRHATLQWKKTAFVIFKPDLIHQNLQSLVWRFLEWHGCELVVQRYGWIADEQRALLYADHRHTGRTNWELGAQLYKLGPALFMLVRMAKTPKGHESTASYLSSELKGHFVPSTAERGTIRADFNAQNPVFNLVHIADNEIEAEREATIFFRDSELEAMVRDRDEGTSPAGVLACDPTPRLMHFELLLLSMLAKLTMAQHEHDPIATAISKGERLLKETGIAERQRRRQVLNATLDHCSTLLAAQTRRRASDELAEGLLDYRNYGHTAFGDLRALLAGHQIPLSEWEEYLLVTSMYYYDFQ